MNMWGITPEFFETLKTGFDEFLLRNRKYRSKSRISASDNDLDLLSDGKPEEKAQPTHQWFVTHKEMIKNL